MDELGTTPLHLLTGHLRRCAVGTQDTLDYTLIICSTVVIYPSHELLQQIEWCTTTAQRLMAECIQYLRQQRDCDAPAAGIHAVNIVDLA